LYEGKKVSEFFLLLFFPRESAGKPSFKHFARMIQNFLAEMKKLTNFPTDRAPILYICGLGRNRRSNGHHEDYLTLALALNLNKRIS
jgi:hypothetical protein